MMLVYSNRFKVIDNYTKHASMRTVPSIMNEGGRGEEAGDLLLRLREECAINLNNRIE